MRAYKVTAATASLSTVYTLILEIIFFFFTYKGTRNRTVLRIRRRMSATPLSTISSPFARILHFFQLMSTLLSPRDFSFVIFTPKPPQTLPHFQNNNISLICFTVVVRVAMSSSSSSATLISYRIPKQAVHS